MRPPPRAASSSPRSRPSCPLALAHLQRGNIAPVDLAQAAIGPGMAVYTRYAKVLDAEGKPLSVREALALINQTLDEALAEQEGDFDADSRWALAWFEQSASPRASTASPSSSPSAKNTSVAGMVEAGILESRRGKVRLLKPDELPADWDPATDPRLTAWEIVHHLIRVLASGGEGAAAELVAKLGAKAEIARELAYRLYTLCERKKRAAEALAYNGLVQSWPEIMRLAREERAKHAARRAEPTVPRLEELSPWRSPTSERVGKALELLETGLAPFVERELKSHQDADSWRMEVARRSIDDRNAWQERRSRMGRRGAAEAHDGQAWNDGVRRHARPAERSLVSELRRRPQQVGAPEPILQRRRRPRARLDRRVCLTAVSAPQADEVGKMKMELRRLIFDEQVRGEKRKAGGSLIEAPATGNLKPWREVVTPHADVASGRYQQAEFAADLWQVHLGEGTDEYRNPTRVLPPHLSHREPEAPAGRRRAAPLGQGRRSGRAAPDQFRRRQDPLDAGALSPVLRRRAQPSLPGVDAVLAEAGVKTLPTAKRVVLVGNKISPGNPVDQARRHGRAHAVGRAGVAARRQEGLRTRQGRRRERRPARATCCASCSTSTGRA